MMSDSVRERLSKVKKSPFHFELCVTWQSPWIRWWWRPPAWPALWRPGRAAPSDSSQPLNHKHKFFYFLVAVCHSFCIYFSNIQYCRYNYTSFIHKHSLRLIYSTVWNTKKSSFCCSNLQMDIWWKYTLYQKVPHCKREYKLCLFSKKGKTIHVWQDDNSMHFLSTLVWLTPDPDLAILRPKTQKNFKKINR